MVSRREWIAAVLGGMGVAAASPLSALEALQNRAPQVVVHKSPTCGCCAKWVDHLQASGFRTTVHDMGDVQPIKTKHRVPSALASCHTALVGGYVVEGHVPADLIHRLLREKPRVLGIAVPGMPMGSPGMEGPYRDRYEVLAFDASGKTRVFAKR